jgi:photosystem II stability/assembly factor-like uncharacterized protein
MKKPNILLQVIIVSVVFTVYSIVQKSLSEISFQHSEKAQEEEEEEKQSGAGRQLMSWFQAKGYPDPTYLTDKYQRAWQQALELKAKTHHQPSHRMNAANWTNTGPVTGIGGRVLCVAIDPNNSNNLWAGSASGGIWKSTNAGTSWTPVTTNLPVLGVSSIIVHPSNSNIIYAGTGEVYNLEAGVMGFNVWKTRGTYGIGIIKSTDGGATWSQVLTKSMSDMFCIQKLKFKPGNPATIYACATDGLYRSTDNGTTWTQILAKTYVRDIVINPSNTDQILVSVGNMENADKGIYRTTNGDNATPTWTKITSGLPSSFAGSIRLDNAGSGLVVASIGVASTGSPNEIYRSTDFGANWSVSSNSNHCSYQFWFAHTVAINPFATDSIMFGGVGLYRYRISNATRTSVSGIHADHHDIVFDPVHRGRIYVANDGGVYKSTNGGSTFSAINNGLNATQFYASLGVSRTNPNLMVGGLQDNGQVVYNGSSWVVPMGAGGDGTTCAIHPTNDNIILACRDARAIKRSTNGGSSFSELSGSYWGFNGDSRVAFVAPIAFAPSNGNIVYQGSDNLHKSTDAGASFSNNSLGSTPPYPTTTPGNYIEQRHKTAIALAVSPTDVNKVYVSTSPFAQYDNDVNSIYVNGQPNVLKTTTGNTPFTSIKGTLPDRFVMDFAISKFNDDSVYVVLGGFGTSHVYLTPDGGNTWLSRGAGLPDVPFNAIVIDPINPQIIYAGSDIGVYVSPDRGLTWQDYNNGFWDVVQVYDLQISADNKLIAATHGKGVFKSDLFSLSTLPATLIDFSGNNRNQYNEIRWTVTDEYDISHYELQKSSNGIHYSAVASMPGRNSTAQTTYTYHDWIGNGSSENFYRLKMVNADGSFTYSTVIFIRTASQTQFSVLNNPFRDQIILQYNSARDKTIRIRLLNASGALVRRIQYRITAGTGAYTLYGMNALIAGMYILEIETDDFRETIKLFKN